MTTKKIDPLMTDATILQTMGERLARIRIDSQLTQATLAEQAGVSKRTVERIESGESAQLSSLIRILRILNLLPGVDALIPASGPRPMDLLKQKGRARKRASSPRNAAHNGVKETSEWTWNEDNGNDDDA